MENALQEKESRVKRTSVILAKSRARLVRQQEKAEAGASDAAREFLLVLT